MCVTLSPQLWAFPRGSGHPPCTPSHPEAPWVDSGLQGCVKQLAVGLFGGFPSHRIALYLQGGGSGGGGDGFTASVPSPSRITEQCGGQPGGQPEGPSVIPSLIFRSLGCHLLPGAPPLLPGAGRNLTAVVPSLYLRDSYSLLCLRVNPSGVRILP